MQSMITRRTAARLAFAAALGTGAAALAMAAHAQEKEPIRIGVIYD